MNESDRSDVWLQPLLITGAGRGIGAATALAAARSGRDLVLNYSRNEIAAKEVAQAVRDIGRKALVVQADVSRAEDVRRMFDEIEARVGALHGLVNNAGITGLIGPFMQTAESTIEEVFRVNVFGAMQCAREALANFRRHSVRGVIVNISSVAARTGSPGEYVHYAASKAAIEAFTLGLAKEVAAEGIRVCGLAPGSTLTEIHAAAGEPGRPERIAPKIPLGRLAEPAEIAEAIVWLASSNASYVTGTTLACAGGL